MNGPAVYLGIQVETGAGLFVGVGEDTEAIELRRLYEIAEDLEIGFGLTRESDDHAGADGHAGNTGADALQQLQEEVAVRTAFHSLQYRCAGVLQRHVDVLHEGRV